MRRGPSSPDEFPVHQAPLPIAQPATSDRNSYDRCYLNAQGRTGEVFVVTSIGRHDPSGFADFLSVAP